MAEDLFTNIETKTKKHVKKGILYADGGSRGNPGKAAGGAVLYDEKKKEIAYGGIYCGTQTNNFAEYAGMLHGLQLAVQNGITDLEVILDSKLIVEQMKGNFKVKHPNLKPSFEQAKIVCAKFEMVRFRHVLRHKNTVADSIVNKVLDQHE